MPRRSDHWSARRGATSVSRTPPLAAQLGPVLPIAGVILTFIVIAAKPELYAPWLVMAMLPCALFAYWFGRRFTVPYLATEALALLVLGLWFRPSLWFAAYVVWLVASTFVVLSFGALAARADAAERRYDALVNGLDAVVWESTSDDGPADYVSDHVTHVLGYAAEQCKEVGFLASRVHPDDLGTALSSRSATSRVPEGTDDHAQQASEIAAAEIEESRFRVLDAWGVWHHMLERVRTERLPDGRVLRRGIAVDETERWEAEHTVRRYVDFIEGIPIALVILRLDDPTDPRSLTVVAANPAAAALIDADLETAIGKRVVDLLPSSQEFLTRLADVVRIGQPLEHPFVELFGVDEVFAMRAVPLQDNSIGLALEDVTKRTRLAETFRHQAEHDPLTGLPNRALLQTRLTSRLAVLGGSPRTALLMIDLNQFKEVNDALGHEAGDRLLIEVARRLAGSLPKHELLARLGGDEFAILLDEDCGVDQATAMAVKASDLCDEPFQIDRYRIQVSASVGIALAPNHATDAETLLRRADSAMYRAKRAGGGIAIYAPGQDQIGVRRLELLADLRDAIHSDDFVIEYQPRFALPSMRPVGVEALIRWQHPTHGLLPPSEFIELAEVSGAIQHVARLVTRRAIEEIGAYSAEHGLRISVNLSIRNLYDPTLVGWVADLIEEADLPTGLLCFELIESQLMDDPSQALAVLEDLRRLGIRLSVDDFGVGYSSLAYLRELPIDEVKIDRSFIADLDRGDARIVRSVIELGHNLGLHVVGEGVETAVGLERLCELDCDSAQGFHLSVPLAADDLMTFLDQARARHAATARSAWEGLVTRR